ncbi:MAG: hypothetical protein IM584_06060 [Chitinophagaceae bacterium]|nr:hypothetical protein [Chitinophagaceae bacterium]MEA3426002.1 hypothetical protein [Bacteroidota bacterium]MCA6451941.1 hypothetical protein [Chitinophagaceae bacterium]MCA6455683.1 hypothetical protein [Chitinophagaceae bacterium]MCA6459474.1 hypothetical protein [Chitinophagaceae bacterium]
MTRVILDVPNDKMQPFLKAILGLGLASHTIQSKRLRKPFIRQVRQNHSLKRISSSFLLFDWEFFSNELEYE